MNRREDDDSDDTNRWLVSYADFITLLFALFVVLYAYSQANEAKHQALSEAIGEAFGRSGAACCRPPARSSATSRARPRWIHRLPRESSCGGARWIRCAALYAI